MKAFAGGLTALLFFGILTLWVQERWAWSLFQVGIFLLTALRLARKNSLRFQVAHVPLAAAALWPLLQLAAGQTVLRGETWVAALNWGTFFLVFLLSCDTFAETDARTWFLKT